MNLPQLGHLMLPPLQAKGPSGAPNHTVGPTVLVPGEQSARPTSNEVP